MSRDSCQINWGPTVYCIPSGGEREQREINPFIDLRSQIKRTERGPQGARSRWGGFHFFCTFGTRLVPFPQDGSTKDIQRYSGNRAKRWNNSQILFTAGMLESNVHRVKQQYWPHVVSAQSKMNSFQLLPHLEKKKKSINAFNPVKQSLETLVFKAKIWDDFHQFVPFLRFSGGGTDRCTRGEGQRGQENRKWCFWCPVQSIVW